VDELKRLFKDEQKPLVDGILAGTCLTKVEITHIVAALGSIEQMWQMLDSDLTAILTNLQKAEVGGDEKIMAYARITVCLKIYAKLADAFDAYARFP